MSEFGLPSNGQCLGCIVTTLGVVLVIGFLIGRFFF